MNVVLSSLQSLFKHFMSLTSSNFVFKLLDFLQSTRFVLSLYRMIIIHMQNHEKFVSIDAHQKWKLFNSLLEF